MASLDEIGAAPDLARRVGELILATKPAHAPAEASPPLAHLLDSDLAIFASPTSRYQRYADAVRSEYAHIEETMFRAGRSSILETYLQAPTIYRTQTAIDLWEQRARTNLLTEIEQLQAPGGGDTPHATGA